MNTVYTWLRFLFFSLMLLWLSAGSSGCTKKCQQPATEVFKSITDTEWRLVSSSNPKLKTTLTNFNFLTYKFNINNEGTVGIVQNNNTPQKTLDLFFNPVKSNNTMAVQYYSPVEEGQDGKKTGGEPVGSPITYSVELDRELRLTEVRTGFTYRMVPFTGAVKPDELCEF